MIAAETWRRLTAHWGALGLAGLYAALINLAAGSLLWLVLRPAGMSPAFALMWFVGTGGVSQIGALLAGAALALVVAFVMFTLVAPLAMGGLVHGVVQVQEGRPVKFGDLWQAGLRHWARLFRLYLVVFAVVIGLVIALLILRLVPDLGPTVWTLGAGMISLVLCGYGPYMAITEGLGARQTCAKAYRILSDKFTDVFLALLVLLAAAVALGLITRILAHIPLLGPLVRLSIDVFAGPTVLLYLATRYRTNIAPHFGPPGGTGTWDPGPPTGP